MRSVTRDRSQLVYMTVNLGGQTYVAMDAFGGAGTTFSGVTNGYANVAPAWSR